MALPDIFLSYSREDQATARRFAEGFERAGFSVWWDATLNAGEAYDQVTEKALKEAKAVVVLWSKTSVDSRWVRAEATLADRLKTLVPVMIEACERPIMFELTHTADLSHWNGDASDRDWLAYLASVRRFVDRDRAPSVAAHAPGTPAPPVPTHGAGRYRRIATVGAGMVALLVVAGGIQWALTRGPGAVATPAAQNDQKAVSLAVLPFADMSPAHDQEYFSDGLSEELLNQLAQIRDLKIAGRTSSFSFKGKNEDLRVIGRKLGVNHILEGSVRKDGERLRITAQLIDAANGTHVWSQTYDRQLKDVFEVQEAIAKDVAQALSITLDVGAMSRARGGTNDLAAYDKYLRAHTLLAQLGPQQLNEALQLYREAEVLDPMFARAWYEHFLALSRALVWLPEKATATRREMAEVAMHLESISPDAWWTHAMRSARFVDSYQWVKAETEAKSMQATAPPTEMPSVANAFASVYLAVGRAEETVALYQRARDADPLSLAVSGFLQLTLEGVGRNQEADAELERSRDFAGDHAIWEWNAVVRMWRRPDVAPAALNAQFQRFLKIESLPMPINRYMSDKLYDVPAARAAIAKAFADPAYQDATRIGVLSIWAHHYGNDELSLAAIRRATVDLHWTALQILWGPETGGFRNDPRFKQIVRDLKIVDYWRATGNWGDYCKPVGDDDFECH
jgi:TolB-like protein